MQIGLYFLRFFCFDLSMHLNDCQIGSLLILACRFGEYFVCAVFELRVLHFMVKLIRVSEISFEG